MTASEIEGLSAAGRASRRAINLVLDDFSSGRELRQNARVTRPAEKPSTVLEAESEHAQLELLSRLLAGCATDEERQRAMELLSRDPELAEAFGLAEAESR